MSPYLRILRYFRPYRMIVAVTWLFSILIVGLQVLSVWVGAILVERIYFLIQTLILFSTGGMG